MSGGGAQAVPPREMPARRAVSRTRVVTASLDKTAWVWDAATGKPVPRFVSGPRSQVCFGPRSLEPVGRRDLDDGALGAREQLRLPTAGRRDAAMGSLLEPHDARRLQYRPPLILLRRQLSELPGRL